MPYLPRADRPELLKYFIRAIIYSLSKPYYGPQILSIFCKRFLAIFRNRFLVKKPGEMRQWTHNLREHSRNTVSERAFFSYFRPEWRYMVSPQIPSYLLKISGTSLADNFIFSVTWLVHLHFFQKFNLRNRSVDISQLWILVSFIPVCHRLWPTKNVKIFMKFHENCATKIGNDQGAKITEFL